MGIVDNFNQKTISGGLHTKWAGKTVHFADEIDSTNLWIKRLAAEGAEEGTLAVADVQTQGRGRLGRRWTAPAGSSIAMSLLLRPDFAPDHASMLTLIMGLSVAQACRRLGLDSWIKWPNDVVIHGKKICGILTEMNVSSDKIDYVVIGTGINVNLKKFPDELQGKATSLWLEEEREYDRLQVLDEVLQAFEENYSRFLKPLDLSLLREDYELLLANKDYPVCVLDPKGEYTGIARGILDSGELIVVTEDGQVRQISTGEVSVRGIYGYV